jgi:hypothetical protein
MSAVREMDTPALLYYSRRDYTASQPSIRPVIAAKLLRKETGVFECLVTLKGCWTFHVTHRCVCEVAQSVSSVKSQDERDVSLCQLVGAESFVVG